MKIILDTEHAPTDHELVMLKSLLKVWFGEDSPWSDTPSVPIRHAKPAETEPSKPAETEPSKPAETEPEPADASEPAEAKQEEEGPVAKAVTVALRMIDNKQKDEVKAALVKAGARKVSTMTEEQAQAFLAEVGV